MWRPHHVLCVRAPHGAAASSPASNRTLPGNSSFRPPILPLNGTVQRFQIDRYCLNWDLQDVKYSVRRTLNMKFMVRRQTAFCSFCQKCKLKYDCILEIYQSLLNRDQIHVIQQDFFVARYSRIRTVSCTPPHRQQDCRFSPLCSRTVHRTPSSPPSHCTHTPALSSDHLLTLRERWDNG